MKVRNLNYNRNGSIDMEIEHEVYGWIPFTASDEDVDQLGKDLYAQAVEGKFGEVGAVTPYTKDELASQVREKRNELLQEVDTVTLAPLRWASYTEQEQNDFALYQKLLKDIPNQPSFPTEVIFPKKPKVLINALG